MACGVPACHWREEKGNAMSHHAGEGQTYLKRLRCGGGTRTWLAKVRKLSFFSPSCSTLMVLATTSSESVWPRKRLGKSICPPCGGCGLGRATRELPVGVGRGERDTRTLPPTRLEPLTVGFHQRVRGLLHLLPSRHALPHRLGQGLRHAVPCAIH